LRNYCKFLFYLSVWFLRKWRILVEMKSEKYLKMTFFFNDFMFLFFFF
jgi:hypothetical protein